MYYLLKRDHPIINQTFINENTAFAKSLSAQTSRLHYPLLDVWNTPQPQAAINTNIILHSYQDLNNSRQTHDERKRKKQIENALQHAKYLLYSFVACFLLTMLIEILSEWHD